MYPSLVPPPSLPPLHSSPEDAKLGGSWGGNKVTSTDVWCLFCLEVIVGLMDSLYLPSPIHSGSSAEWRPGSPVRGCPELATRVKYLTLLDDIFLNADGAGSSFPAGSLNLRSEPSIQTSYLNCNVAHRDADELMFA